MQAFNSIDVLGSDFKPWMFLIVYEVPHSLEINKFDKLTMISQLKAIGFH